MTSWNVENYTIARVLMESDNIGKHLLLVLVIVLIFVLGTILFLSLAIPDLWATI